MHEVLVNRLGGLSLPRKSVVRLTDRPDMTLDVYRGRKTTIQSNIRFGSKLYRQIVGIPMSPNYAPLVADLFLLCYERDFMLSLLEDNQSDVIISRHTLGIVNGQISIIYHRVMALINGQKIVLASSSFTIWSIMMKLHKNDQSNKSFLLA